VVEDEETAPLPLSQAEGDHRPVTVNTFRIRQALGLYDKLKGESPDSRMLPGGADIVLRFDPDGKEGYALKRVEVGVAGRSLWLVHDMAADVDAATSIQYKKEW
jgi:hypothetical protein